MTTDDEREYVTLRCPQCGRFIAEVKGFGRGVCNKCGSEMVRAGRGHFLWPVWWWPKHLGGCGHEEKVKE